MKKKLSEEEFQAATAYLEVGQQTLEIAYGVLVQGRPQAHFVNEYALSKGAVSQAVNRVWVSFQSKNLPRGYERVTALLPKYKAFIVKRWAEDTEKSLEAKK